MSLATRRCDAGVAERIRASRLAESAMQRNFPIRKFEEVVFEELHDFWWEYKAQSGNSGFEYLTPEILERLGSMKARAITSQDIKDYLDEKKLEGLSASSLNHRRTILNSVFNFAIKWKKFDECRKISDELWVFVRLLITTSARTMEVLARKWTEVHFDAEIPYIYVPETKSGREKILYPTPEDVEALKSLESYQEEEEYVFPSRPTARHPEPVKPHRWSFGKEFRRAALKAGLRKEKGKPEENLRIHDLRHVSISIMTSHGVPEPVIRMISGHSSQELQRYQHLMGDIPEKTVKRDRRGAAHIIRTVDYG